MAPETVAIIKGLPVVQITTDKGREDSEFAFTTNGLVPFAGASKPPSVD